MPDKKRLTPAPASVGSNSFSSHWLVWFDQIYRMLGPFPVKVPGYSVSNVPNAAEWGNSSSGTAFSSLIFVHDETGGATLAFSDGTNWLRVQDRATVS